MTLGRQALIWFVVALIFGVILFTLSGIMLPFVAGMAVAYFLDPIADRLESWGMSRFAATSVITIVGLLVFLLALVLLLPVLQEQILRFIERAPGYAEQIRLLFAQFLEGRIGQFISGVDADSRAALTDIAKAAAGWAGRVIQGALSGGLAFISFLSLVFVTPIVAFYMLLDWDRMMTRVDGWLPRDHAPTVRKLAAEIDDMLSGFVRGQVTVCLVLGTFYATALSLLGLEFGLVVGLVAGLISFIPFVGATVGLVVSVTLALIQFWPDPIMIGAVAAVFLAGQALEGNVLTPWLVGSRVRLHPVWVIFALFAFGAIFGFVGVLLALPLAAMIGVLARFGIGEYMKSNLYRGTSSQKGADEPGPKP